MATDRNTLSGRSILIVDDNQDVAEVMLTVLRHNGATVETAYSGAKALDKARGQDFDIILLDIGLPDITGTEVARTIRDEQRDKSAASVLVALTGYGDSANDETDSLFDRFLVKPIGARELIHEMETVWAGRTDPA